MLHYFWFLGSHYIARWIQNSLVISVNLKTNDPNVEVLEILVD